MDEVRELEWVSNKKYRCVIPHEIIIAFFGVKLDCKASRIPGGISRTLFAANGGKTSEDIGALSYLRKKLGFGIPGYVSSNFKIAVCSRSFCMHNSFGNSLVVKVAQLL